MFSFVFGSCPALAAARLTLLAHVLVTLSNTYLVYVYVSLVLPSQLRIGLLDWGQTKELGREDREKVANLILAVSSHVSPDIVRW